MQKVRKSKSVQYLKLRDSLENIGFAKGTTWGPNWPFKKALLPSSIKKGRYKISDEKQICSPSKMNEFFIKYNLHWRGSLEGQNFHWLCFVVFGPDWMFGGLDSLWYVESSCYTQRKFFWKFDKDLNLFWMRYWQ